MAESGSHYTFLPWYRTGLASAVSGTEADRGKLNVILHAKLGDAAEDFSRSIQLIGPGDLIGIDPRAVVRVEPRPFTNDFEPNYLAAIEFFDEDYAWRYSPRAPGPGGKGQLIPWLTLLVLETSEFKLQDQGEGLPRKIDIADTSILPPPGELWAWAHTHLNAVVVDPNNPRGAADQIAANPAASCCRILGPRHLLPLKAYHAFLVPTFESGRRAGLLGAAPRNDSFAWQPGQPATLPVYYEWSFRTSEEGDFKELALRLQRRPADPTIGRRPMDLSHPMEHAAFPPIRDTANPSRPVLDLEGALQVPGAQHSGWEATSKAAFQARLAEFINLGEAWELKDLKSKIEGEPPLPNGIKLPVILPPSYGRFHANVDLLSPAKADSRWLEQLTLDPRNRAAAAYGTLVVQKNQEDFMARAWKQYGELFAANRLRYRAQLFREVLTAIEAKHVQTLPPERVLTVTSLMHARIPLPATKPITVLGQIQASVLPAAAVQAPIRRVLRDNGPVARRFGIATPHLRNIIADIATARVTVSPAWTQPATRLTLASSPAVSDAPDATPWLGSEWDLLRPILVAHIERTERLAIRMPQLNEHLLGLNDILQRGDLQSTLSATRLTPTAVEEVRTAAQWAPPSLDRAALREEDFLPAAENRNFSFLAWNFRQATLATTELLTIALPLPAVAPPLDVGGVAQALRKGISPYATVAERIARLIALPPAVKMPAYDPLEMIMAYPRFDDPTYEYLKKISQEYVVPNLSKIANNTITLLEINWSFIESFLVGLNHEMGRELLWRRYPTDQRGSYFRLFWDARAIPNAIGTDGKVVEKSLDIHPIHGWRLGDELTKLGGNRPLARPDLRNIVLVIRGDLLRRYPNTQVYAAKAVLNPEKRQEFTSWNRRPEDDNETFVQHPVLFAKFDPDIYCYGFNLEEPETIGKLAPEPTNLGWYFVLAERFGEPRFGLDSEAPKPGITDANDLSWGHLIADPDSITAIDLSRYHAKPAMLTTVPGNATWAADAADMAAILLREPARVYYHGNDMLKPPP